MMKAKIPVSSGVLARVPKRFLRCCCILVLIITSLLMIGVQKSLGASGTGAVDDTNIIYIGRWDKTSSTTLYHGYWDGAYLKVNFTGTGVAIKLDSTNSVNIYASIDGGADTLYSNALGTVILASGLAAGTHTLRVATRSETDIFRFQGLVLDSGATTLPPSVHPNLIEYVGDSITSGYKSSENALTSYSWLAAEGLNAEHVNISQVGICLVDNVHCGWTLGQNTAFFQLQTAAFPGSPAWNFSLYQPNAVVINLGTNDAAYGVSDSTFQSVYTSFIQNIRSKYPKTRIFAMRPFNGAKVGPVQAAVNARNASGDTLVHFIDTTGWTTSTDFFDGLHLTDDGNVKVAHDLIAVIQPYLQAAATPTLTATRTPTFIPPTATSKPTNTPTLKPSATLTPKPGTTPTPTFIPPTVTPAPSATKSSAAIKVQYKPDDLLATDNALNPDLMIVNTSSASVALSQLKIRYWFTRDSAQSLVFGCVYAPIGCSNILGSFVSLPKPVSGADTYLEIAFSSTAGNVAAGGNSDEIQTYNHKLDWSNFNETNDYSYDSTHTAYADSTTITLYQNGTLIWGKEPIAPPPTATLTPTITPTGFKQALKLQYYAAITNATTTQINPYMIIFNNSSSTIPLYELKVRYWFTRDTPRTVIFNCYSAKFGCGSLYGSFTYLTTPLDHADTYLEMGFNGSAGSIAANSNTGEIQISLNKNDWSNFTQTNDYSFDAGRITYGDFNRITLYRNGVLVWGKEP